MTESRRVHERFDCELDVALLIGDREIAGKTRNVSLGGLLLSLAEPVTFGTTGKVRVRFPALKQDAELPVTVRWVNKGEVGVQFGSLRALEVWAINQLMKGA
jgi:hypothetical protein